MNNPNRNLEESLSILSHPKNAVNTHRSNSTYLLTILSLILLACGAWVTLKGQHLEGSRASPRDEKTNAARVDVLVTGFLPFLDYPSNPAGNVAQILNGTCRRAKLSPEVCFTGIQVEVTSEGVQEAVREAHAEGGNYSLIIHLGFENRAKGLKLEGFSANVLASMENPSWSVDMSSLPPGASEIDSAWPWLLPTTAPLSCARFTFFQKYTRSEHARNVSTLWSRDAGAYFCNELYFRSLAAGWLREQSKDSKDVVPVLFVHVPPLDLVELSELLVVIEDIAVALARCL
mmetsp:Transcript_46279/g.93411  ORF Transcript_46279/g.93411 Transcript_46279/m.93411 type:complete len:289 (+) Transcript_46279:106-972(+)